MTILAFKPRPVEDEAAPSPHYLLFGPTRSVTGCGCGFQAHDDDYGYGNSVVAHLLKQGH
jgi:hypothetical protein